MVSLLVTILLSVLWGILAVELFPDSWLIVSVLGGFVIGSVCSYIDD